MMQSLAEVEPVVLDASFECALGISGLAVEESLPLPPVNSGVAERFESAMSKGFIAPSEFRRMVLAVDSSEKTLHTVEDFADKPVRVVGKLAENKVVHTAETVPHSPIHVAEDLPEEVVNTIKDSSTTVSYVTEDLPLRTVKGSRAAEERIVPSAPKEVSAQKVRVLPDVPETQFVREVRVVKSILPDQTQIIAPAPLPIELPAEPVRRQELAPAVPSDVTRMLVTAAEAVADAILVSSGFSNGEGSIIVRLQPEVLGGSEVRIVVKDGTLSVVINAATQDVHEIVEANRTQFEQHLADKVHSWRVSVAVRRGGKLDERV